jgi:hypothetical protein
MDNKSFNNDMGLPDELLPILVDNWSCEYASLKNDGTPITIPLIPFPGEDGRTIDINTGLAYPTKAERARNNPKVCLLFSEPRSAPAEKPPVVLVYGKATVCDADLQTNTDRYVRGFLARMKFLSWMPRFLMRGMRGYLARIWIAVTPLKVIWWTEGDMEKEPKEWHAPEGTHPPPCDPKPDPLTEPHQTLVTPKADWREDIAYALEKLGPPVLTVVDGEGYPVPFRTKNGILEPDGVRLNLLPVMPTSARGRACLTFHTLAMNNGMMVSNENLTFIGDVDGRQDEVLFKVERSLQGVSFKMSMKGILELIRVIRGFRSRLEAEAFRRGQPVPAVRFPGEY